MNGRAQLKELFETAALSEQKMAWLTQIARSVNLRIGWGETSTPVLSLAVGELLVLQQPLCLGRLPWNYLMPHSLVHDDLPAMDDDDFRRGRPNVKA